eukprot:jgi/Mesen1/4200/ME000219S03334
MECRPAASRCQVSERPVAVSAALATEAPVSEESSGLQFRDDIRNIAIIAHVDHGKTTLVDAMLRQAKVDSVEGPMPQTRFVLKKALALGHRVVVVINKVDRPNARVEYVINSTFELFCELEASDEQCDFQTVYASGIQGKAGLEPENLAEDLEPLFETVIRCIPQPRVDKLAPLQMLVTNLDYDEHKGRIAIGRVHAGTIKRNDEIKVNELFVYENFSRKAVDSVEAGDICALSGLSDVMIGETLAQKVNGVALPTISVELPTVKMSFSINTSPFAGKEGKFVTSRNLRDRLYRELERNLAMKVEDGETADTFLVSGRGTLHITILIENMRREGYEFMVGPPRVIAKELNGKRQEPYEDVVVEVPTPDTGSVVDMLGKRKGQMLDLQASGAEGATTVVKYRMPTRGLLGLRNALLTATRGTAIINTIFHGYGDWAGDMGSRDRGCLVSCDQGPTSTYALFTCQDRGDLFLGPAVEIYKGQIIGIHQRPGDLDLNACKKKAATNVRSNKDATVVLNAPIDMSLDDCVEFIQDDELVEITPLSVRMLKNPKMGKKGGRK